MYQYAITEVVVTITATILLTVLCFKCMVHSGRSALTHESRLRIPHESLRSFADSIDHAVNRKLCKRNSYGSDN